MDNTNPQKDTNNLQERDGFASRLGIIAAAAGSAIGLGNIWRFPYITGQYGGAAFILIYLICIVLMGMPLMISEFAIGRMAQKNAIGSFKKLAPHTYWFLIGVMGIAGAIMILAFYGVVSGWCIDYVVRSATNAFAGKSTESIIHMFDGLITHTWMPLLWQFVFMILTGIIVIAGIQNGIEKYAKILMPLLLLIIIILDIRAVTLPGAKEGLSFLFKPDFTKLSTEVMFVALGHAFFSLSIGMGTMITYGSYIGKRENLGVTALQVTIADTLVALLAGVAIFPAVFAFGINPTEGPGLAFITLPVVFQQMPFGNVFGTLFFLLLVVAALTSSISILEVIVAYFSEELKMSRKKATILSTTIVTLIGIPASLSNGPVLSNFKILGFGFMDLLDYVSANILLPIGGLLILAFGGWYLGREKMERELTNGGTIQSNYLSIFMILTKFIAPIGIALVFLKGLGFM
ncbi:sodium-dependent transporter [Clostridiaceae bacterium 35-E11]